MLRYELDITGLVKQLQRPAETLSVTVVLTPAGKAAPATAGLTVRSLSVRVLESTVKRKA